MQPSVSEDRLCYSYLADLIKKCTDTYKTFYLEFIFLQHKFDNFGKHTELGASFFPINEVFCVVKIYLDCETELSGMWVSLCEGNVSSPSSGQNCTM